MPLIRRKPRVYVGDRVVCDSPQCQDPFVNTPLLRLPDDPRTGLERFWISTFNGCVGALGVVTDEHGNGRVVRFDNWRLCGFYSAATDPNDPDGLWLVGGPQHFARLSLKTLKHEVYPGVDPRSLAFQGMPLDPATGRLFLAYLLGTTRRVTIFDTKKRQAVGAMDSPGKGLYMRASFPNPDCTWSIVHQLPGVHVVRWDPRDNRMTAHDLVESLPVYGGYLPTPTPVADAQGNRYLAGVGWYSPAMGKLVDGPRPKDEAAWFGQHDGVIYGAKGLLGSVTILAWRIGDGSVKPLITVPDATGFSFNITRSGKLIGVGMYGVFVRYDLKTGALEMSRRFPTDSYASIDCLVTTDDGRIIGTPFITQRFWEVDTRTNQGADMGRAAPGGGEIMKVTKVDGIVYMAAYTGGELMRYDPALPARYPENPRVVADPPRGMRPVGICNDGRNIYYSSSIEYGNLGSVLTAYDTRTGLARYASNPLSPQQVMGMILDGKRTLIVGTTIHADCQSCPPTESAALIGWIDCATLESRRVVKMFDGCQRVNVIGWVTRRSFLVTASMPDGRQAWAVIDKGRTETVRQDELTVFDEPPLLINWSNTAGLFYLKLDYRLEVWDWRGKSPRPVRLLHEKDHDLCHIDPDGDGLLFTYPRRVAWIKDPIKGL